MAGARDLHALRGVLMMDASRPNSEMRWAFLMLMALGLAVTLTIYAGLSG